MRHAVIIPSTRRPDVLGATLRGLARQSVPADVVVVCVAAPEDVPVGLAEQEGVLVVVSERGSSVQRNNALRALHDVPDLVTYLDDDVELRRDYFERAREFFVREPDAVLMTGLVAADGSGIGEIARSHAVDVIADQEPHEFTRDVRAAYGCNMTARGAVAQAEPFDERLRLYAWQEDNDFSVRVGRYGRVVHYHGCVCVHLAVSSGRVNGRAFGFAQIVNPFYMWRKGTKTARELMHDWSLYLGGNALHFVGRRRPDRADRSGRLTGNVLGLREVALHGGRPEAVEQVAARGGADA